MTNVAQQIADHFGGPYRLAAVLEVSSVAVHWWIKKGCLPPKRAIQVEKLTDGKFKAVDIMGSQLE